MAFHSFPSSDAAAIQLAEDTAKALSSAIRERGKASLVVSGGSTPKPFFAALKQHALAWDKIWITLADERWVEPNEADSNERMVREQLLTNGAHFVSLKNKAATPAEGVAEVEKALAVMQAPYDVVILGMGEDGHTASLFPETEGLAQALELNNPHRCAAINPPSYAPHPRMTQTLSALLNCRKLILHITGAKKKTLYEEAQKPGSCLTLPVRAIVQQDKVPLEVYWAA
ncbi:MAG TPA: 6-phosphogluconolactonase [Rickettsiales bacterium]|nr:6-phosphogluconolactonase [Rickettsiales bacterium]